MDLSLTTADHVTAAQLFNLCRTKGIQGPNTDFLICAVAIHRTLAIFTTDNDFTLYAAHLPIVLYGRKGERGELIEGVVARRGLT